VRHPGDAVRDAIAQINTRMGPTMRLELTAPDEPAPAAPDGMTVLSHTMHCDDPRAAVLHLICPHDEDLAAVTQFLTRLADLVVKVIKLGQRYIKSLKQAMVDDLTGVWNGRFLRVRLKEMLEEARTTYLPVTLFLFDIDDFKKYNDQYGHGVGDEILRETAKLMKKCVREHDIVARISGDEFAVVFWEKEGPRQPRDQAAAPVAGKSQVPLSVRAVCDRFRKLISSPDFQVLGTSGKGTLTISGGLAVFPYDATTAEGLLEAADRELVFKAKKSGKNTIFLVGEEPAKDAAQ
jgi:GGDEF domain-containing protein